MNLNQVISNIRTFFNDGMKKPNPNHLFGSRRLYAAPSSAANEIHLTMATNQQFLAQINRELVESRELMIAAAVVDDEVRLNIYRVDHSVHGRAVGEADLREEGISTFLISRQDGEDPHGRKFIARHLLRADRVRRYNPYQVEVSWSIPLANLEPSLLHEGQFQIMEC